MQVKLARYFIYSAGLLLAITGGAKLISGFGAARSLQEPDPIFSISFQLLFWIVGGIELIIGVVCLLSKWNVLQAGLIALMATNFLVYRLGILWAGYQMPCKCLGNLTGALHIPRQTADTAMKIILAYLLIGSYATLFWLWRQKRKTPPLTPPEETSISAS